MEHHKRDFYVDSRLLRIALIAGVIGILSTLAAAVLINLIRLFTNIFFFQTLSFAQTSPAAHTLGTIVIAIPVIGGLIVGLIARFGSEKVRGHGIPEAIEAILFKKSKIAGKVAVLKPLASGVAIGSGGPFGAEGPVIMTGGTIGSLIAQHIHLTAAERKTLLVSGAAAGMTAVFNSPVAAVLLAVELLLFEWRPRSLLPVVLAASIAAFTRPFLFENVPLFPIDTAPVGLAALPSCVIAGLLAGMLAAGLSKALYWVEDGFHRLPVHWMWWPLLGGLAVGIGGYIEPRAFGIGFDVISDLLNNRLAVTVAAGLLLAKATMWVLALGSGTSGGVLAPLLMLGAGLGMVLGPFLPGADPQVWPLVSMAAVLAAVLGAPLTAVAFALELTHDTSALLPVLLTTSVAYGFTILVMSRSMMTEKIARRGLHTYREYRVDPMERVFVHDIMTRDVIAVAADRTVGSVLAEEFGPTQSHRGFPVVSADGTVLGIIDRGKLQAASPDATIASLFGANPPLFALPGEPCRAVATRMAFHGTERLPVVADAQSRKIIGIISRSDLVEPGRTFFEEEEHRERLAGH
jgi:H+/Cl- antiporter ClcA/CBS domain-containing protein